MFCTSPPNVTFINFLKFFATKTSKDLNVIIASGLSAARHALPIFFYRQSCAAEVAGNKLTIAVNLNHIKRSGIIFDYRLIL